MAEGRAVLSVEDRGSFNWPETGQKATRKRPETGQKAGMVQKPGDSSGTAEAVSTVESSVNFRFSSRELSPYFQAQNEPCQKATRNWSIVRMGQDVTRKRPETGR